MVYRQKNVDEVSRDPGCPALLPPVASRLQQACRKCNNFCFATFSFPLLGPAFRSLIFVFVPNQPGVLALSQGYPQWASSPKGKAASISPMIGQFSRDLPFCGGKIPLHRRSSLRDPNVTRSCTHCTDHAGNSDRAVATAFRQNAASYARTCSSCGSPQQIVGSVSVEAVWSGRDTPRQLTSVTCIRSPGNTR